MRISQHLESGQQAPHVHTAPLAHPHSSSPHHSSPRPPPCPRPRTCGVWLEPDTEGSGAATVQTGTHRSALVPQSLQPGTCVHADRPGNANKCCPDELPAVRLSMLLPLWRLRQLQPHAIGRVALPWLRHPVALLVKEAPAIDDLRHAPQDAKRCRQEQGGREADQGDKESDGGGQARAVSNLQSTANMRGGLHCGGTHWHRLG